VSEPTQATGLKRLVFIGLGFLFTGIGIVGIFVPGLPTTPWLLLASYFFSRSSKRFHTWLRTWPLTGHILHDWEVRRGVRLWVKIFAVVMLILVMGSSIYFGRLGTGLSIMLVCFGFIGATVVVLLPRAREIAAEPVPPARPDSPPPTSPPPAAAAPSPPRECPPASPPSGAPAGGPRPEPSATPP
jgi:uncharacterized membrane protein YbaN (DUF454 family)